MVELIRAYLDTCVVSGLAKGDLRRPTIEALLRILQLQKTGNVHLLTSSVTQDEIAKIPEQHRTPHQAIYTLLAEVPISQTHRADSGLTLMGVGGGVREDSLFSLLKGFLPDESDARHIFQAVKNDVGFFVTADARSILRFRDLVERHCGVKAVNPEELVVVLETRSNQNFA